MMTQLVNAHLALRLVQLRLDDKVDGFTSYKKMKQSLNSGKIGYPRPLLRTWTWTNLPVVAATFPFLPRSRKEIEYRGLTPSKAGSGSDCHPRVILCSKQLTPRKNACFAASKRPVNAKNARSTSVASLLSKIELHVGKSTTPAKPLKRLADTVASFTREELRGYK